MLENKTIISTRPHTSNDQLIELLQNAGARCISMPMIAVEINELSPDENNVFLNLENYDWLIFTSMNGVRFFFKHLLAIRPEKGFPQNLRTAVVGQSTKEELKKYGIEPALVNTGKTSKDLLTQLLAVIPKEKNPKVVLSLGTLASSLLEEGLKSKAQIDRINVYKTIPPEQIDRNLLQKIVDDQYDLIVLASPSAFHNLKLCLAPFQVDKLRFACIGPTTEASLQELGIHPVVIAESSTSEGMYKSVKNYYEFNNIK